MTTGHLDLNGLLQGGLAVLARASWQGGVAIALVWLLCRLVPRIPPTVRCWLWRLVLVKILLVACWPATIDLPWLQARPDDLATATNSKEGARPGNASIGPVTQAISPSSGGPTESRVPDAGSSPAIPLPSSTWTTVRSVLGIVWAAGVLMVAGILIRRVRAARRWRQGCVLAKDASVLTICEKLSSELGLYQPPVLLVSDISDAPVVFGALRTSVVLPARLLEPADPTRLELILRHELAHIRRGDLVWNWLATGVWGLFFFHPLVWLALRELRLNQELACDAYAVRARGSSPAEYGNLLVELAQRVRVSSGTLVTVGVVESFEFLKRRLKAMSHLHDCSRWVRPLSVSVLSLALLGLLPWRLVAQAPKPDPNRSASAAGQNLEEPARTRTADERRAGKPPLAVHAARPFEIAAQAVRQAGQTLLVDSGFPLEANFTTRSERWEEGPGYHVGAAAAAGGGGGTYQPPDIIVDLQVSRPQGRETPLVCTLIGPISARDDRGRPIEAPELPAHLRFQEGAMRQPLALGYVALPLNLKHEDGTQIKALSGDLLVSNARVQTVAFEGNAIKQRSSRRILGAQIHLDGLESTEEGIQVRLAISPPPAASGRQGFREQVRFLRRLHDRLHVLLEDSDGQTHTFRSGSGGGGGVGGRSGSVGGESGGVGGGVGGVGGSSGGGAAAGGGSDSRWSSASGSSGPGRGGRVGVNAGGSSPGYALNLVFAPLPEGVKVKKITCTLTELVGEPQRISFRFRNLPLPSFQARDPTGYQGSDQSGASSTARAAPFVPSPAPPHGQGRGDQQEQ
jgi:beta-lactamase regulating signal transducer with metallopeptidase domain